jgi:hypothetical protein
LSNALRNLFLTPSFPSGRLRTMGRKLQGCRSVQQCHRCSKLRAYLSSLIGAPKLTLDGLQMIKIGIAIGILSWQTFNMSEVRNVGGSITDNVFTSGSTGYFGYAMYVPPPFPLSLY